MIHSLSRNVVEFNAVRVATTLSHTNEAPEKCP